MIVHLHPAGRDLPRFKAFLTTKVDRGDLTQAVLCHEMSASLNRNRLTNLEEGAYSFNTDQLIWLVMGIGDNTQNANPFLAGAVISALIDRRFDIFDEAKACGIAEFSWVAWADGFTGTAAELRARLYEVQEWRYRCGAISLALRTAPEAIDGILVEMFRRGDTAISYHRLLELALQQPKIAAEVANRELTALTGCLEVLFASDVDTTLSKLVMACQVHDPAALVAPYKDAAGELTKAALARRQLEGGHARQAIATLGDLRYLSEAWPHGVVVAAAAWLSLNEADRAESLAQHIDDPLRQHMVLSRVAELRGDMPAQLDHLITLRELAPRDPEVLLQLLTVLDRVGKSDMSRQIAFSAQEDFLDNPDLLARLQRWM